MKKVMLLAAAAMLSVAVWAGTAPGGATTASAATLDCTSIFSPATAWLGGNSSVFRGGFPEPDLKAGPGDSETPHGNSQDPDPNFTASIPVYVHVVMPSAPPARGSIPTDAQIVEQIAVLNRGFQGYYDVVRDAHEDPGVTNTGFSFSLAGITRTTNDAWWRAEPGTPEEFAMKGALKQGGSTTMNLYVTSGGGYLGWAYFPKINVWHKKYAVLDGVVVHYGSLPGGYIQGFDLGFTAVHEAGHWLGLYHTFDPEPFGCRGDSDRIDDTPAEGEPSFGCPFGKDTCPEPGLDPIHNFMDYSDDPCYTEFSTGQSARMQAQYSHWRLKRA